MELKDLIGEATAYDKKEKLEAGKPKSWLKSVSAFANGNGGTLIFGISDDDRIVGLPIPKATPRSSANMSRPDLTRFRIFTSNSKILMAKD